MSKRSYATINKAVSLMLVSLLLCSGLLAGCASFRNAQVKPVVKNSFTFNYELSNSNLDFFTASDSIDTLLSSSPFYSGSQRLPSQKTDEFDKARSAKIKEILDEADALVSTARKVKPKLATVRSSFLSYATDSFKEEPKLQKFVEESFSQVSLLMSKEQIVESQYKSMDTSGITNPHAKAFEETLKVTKAVELGSLYLEDVNNIGAYAAIAIKATENHPSSRIKRANEELDSNMQALDDIKDDLASIASSIEKIDYGMRQLRTADYYLAQEGSHFIASSLPDLKAKASTLTVKAGLTKEDIAFIQAYLAYFEEFQKILSKSLDSVDKRTLISLDQEKGLGIPIAYAAEKGQNYANAQASLAPSLKSKNKESSAFFSNGWSAIKNTVNKTKLVVGLGVDTAGVAVRNASQIACGLWAGNTTEEIWADMRSNSLELVNNYNRGISGSSTFRTAGEYLENVERAASDVAGSIVEARVGSGWTSWTMSRIAKATIGMFTGLGKGIYKITKTDATGGEIAEGTLDIGLSFVGGSKVVIKASQLPGLFRGLAQQGRLLGKQGFNLLDTVGANIDKRIFSKEIAALLDKNKLTSKELVRLISSSIELQAREAMERTLAEQRGALIKEMTRILREGGEAALQESSAGIKQSLNDLIMTSFQQNMRGYLEAIRTVTGGSTKDYLDNLVGSWADDYVKGLIKEAIDGSPEPGEISGTWTGSWVITEIIMPEPKEGEQNTTLEGCDFDIDWKKLKGKSVPLSLNLTVDSDGSGMITSADAATTGKNSGNNQLPFKYTGGTVVVEKSDKGMTIHMEGQVQRTESGYTINGTLSAVGNGASIKGTWNVTKAK